MHAQVKTGFLGVGSGPRDFGDDSAVVPLQRTSGSRTRAAASHLHLPHVGLPADKAQAAAAVRSIAEDDDPFNPETVHFTLNAKAGAYDAWNYTGNQSGALVAVREAFQFHVDSSGLGDDVRVGVLRIGPLRRAVSYEKLLRLDLLRNGALQKSARNGSRGLLPRAAQRQQLRDPP